MQRPLTAAHCTLLAIFGVSGAARAEIPPPPPECAEATATSQYKTGYTTGGSMTRMAWKGIQEDCNRLEEFETKLDQLLDAYHLPPNASRAQACRYAGIVTAILDAIDGLYITCVDQCYNEGREIGKLSAVMYCELSIAFGGLGDVTSFMRGPVKLCGLEYQNACDMSFIGTSNVYANTDGTCQPYTVDPFTAIWTLARYNLCTYNPIPPPPGAP